MPKFPIRTRRTQTGGLPERLRPWLFGRSFLKVAGPILRSRRQNRLPKSLLPKRSTALTRAGRSKPTEATRPVLSAPSPHLHPGAQAPEEVTEQVRSNLVRSTAARAIALTVGALAMLTIWGLFALAFHTVMPERWAYLTMSQLDSIRSYLGVLLASGLLSDYARRLIGR